LQFAKISSLNGGEGHILAQAFDEMKGHQYANIQQSKEQMLREILLTVSSNT